ncbi:MULTISPECIES: hypothetical protein [Amycolatopsis]|uniref:Uncharacterized protein n=2 Tax=Amycolatopsis TaxID=1813 RepID=A0A1I4APH8_9PSEU|nr:hypothetical protein [Amycolatopsis sacchari]SFK57576.1 hypothetical protein SAMN05421835_12493 [Amycolatopsis sacchari]
MSVVLELAALSGRGAAPLERAAQYQRPMPRLSRRCGAEPLELVVPLDARAIPRAWADHPGRSA